MKRIQLNKKIAFVFVALALVLILVPTFASAKDGRDSGKVTQETVTAENKNTVQVETSSDRQTTRVVPTRTEDNSTQPNTNEDQTSGNLQQAEHAEVARERLGEAKRKICVKREDQVNKIMDSVVKRSQAHIDRITAVADRTKAFYEKQGNTSGVYPERIATVEATRLAAQAAVSTLTSDASFSCDSDGPKSDIQTFHTGRAAKIVAVKAYRDAVKSLIDAVKSAQPQSVTTEGRQ